MDFGAKLWYVLPVDMKPLKSLSSFITIVTKWCHSDAAKPLEKKNVLIVSPLFYYISLDVACIAILY